MSAILASSQSYQQPQGQYLQSALICKTTMVISALIFAIATLAIAGHLYPQLAFFKIPLAFMPVQGQVIVSMTSLICLVTAALVYLKRQNKITLIHLNSIKEQLHTLKIQNQQLRNRIQLYENRDLGDDLVEPEVSTCSAIQILPAETIVYIFTFLTPVELTLCSLVCQQWRQIAISSPIWLQHVCRYIPSDILTEQSPKQTYIDYYNNRALQNTLQQANALRKDLDINTSHINEPCQKFHVYGKKIVALTSAGKLKVWDIETLQLIQEYTLNCPNALCLYVSDYGLCIIGTQDGMIYICDLERSVFKQLQEPGLKITALYINQYRLFAACAQASGNEKSIIIWNTHTLERLNQITYPSYEPFSISFMHSQNNLLVVGSSTIIQLWDLAKQQLFCQIHCPSGIFRDEEDNHNHWWLSENDEQLNSGYCVWTNAKLHDDYLYTYHACEILCWKLKDLEQLFYGKLITWNAYENDTCILKTTTPQSFTASATLLENFSPTPVCETQNLIHTSTKKYYLFDYATSRVFFTIGRTELPLADINACLDTKGPLYLQYNAKELHLTHSIWDCCSILFDLEQVKTSLASIAADASITNAHLGNNCIVFQVKDGSLVILNGFTLGHA